jgi:hypothetical protein
MTTYLIIAIIILQLGDFWTTKVALENGFVELNPIVKFFMTKLGTIPGLFFAKVYVSIMLVVANYYHVFNITYGIQILIGLVIFYAWIVTKNFLLLKGK